MTSKQFDVIANRLRGQSFDWDKVREIETSTASDIIRLLNQGKAGVESATTQINHLLK